jgi:hypothetical protein
VGIVKVALLMLAGGMLGGVGMLSWLLRQLESEERQYQAANPWR